MPLNILYLVDKLPKIFRYNCFCKVIINLGSIHLFFATLLQMVLKVKKYPFSVNKMFVHTKLKNKGYKLCITYSLPY